MPGELELQTTQKENIMATEISVRATWATEWQFEIDDDTGHRVTLDVDEQDGGHNEGFRPMGMLLVAIAGCMGMSVLPILLKSARRSRGTSYMSTACVRRSTRRCSQRSASSTLSAAITCSRRQCAVQSNLPRQNTAG